MRDSAKAVIVFPVVCICFLGFFLCCRVVWVTANIRRCLGIRLRATKTGGRAAAKARVKGLQMGVKTETPAKVNPARLTQAAQAVIKGRSLIQTQPPPPPPPAPPPSCGAVVRLVEPIGKARSHVWVEARFSFDHSFNCRGFPREQLDDGINSANTPSLWSAGPHSCTQLHPGPPLGPRPHVSEGLSPHHQAQTLLLFELWAY